MAENFEKTVQALMNGLENHLSTKTIVGEPIRIDNAVIFPMADVSFGVAAGSFVQDKKNNGTGGVGARMTPSAVLIIQNGTSKIVNIKDKDAVNKLIDMVPDVLNKITGGRAGSKKANGDDPEDLSETVPDGE